jgi:hypothetical protein
MVKDARTAWLPTYQGDEVAVGIALAIALHAIPIAALVYKARHPSAYEVEEPVIARPVIAASMLKLGKPVDPKKLPDRFVPKARAAPKQQETLASAEEPVKKRPDAGAPVPNARESDIANLIAKSDPFAEDAGKVRPEEGHAAGVEGGTETDPNRVRAGDAYAALLGSFLHERWQYPTVISQGEANKLCVIFRISINTRMVLWHVQQTPIRASGNELFDDSARTMLQKLLDDRTALPKPPDEVAESFRGRSVDLALQGNPHGDSSRRRQARFQTRLKPQVEPSRKSQFQAATVRSSRSRLRRRWARRTYPRRSSKRRRATSLSRASFRCSTQRVSPQISPPKGSVSSQVRGATLEPKVS